MKPKKLFDLNFIRPRDGGDPVDPFADDDPQDPDPQDPEPKGQDPKLQDAIAKKQYWRDKAEREKAEKEALQKKLDEVGKQSGQALDIATDIQLKQQFGLDDSDLKVAKGIAAGQGKSVAEMLSDKESEGAKAFETFKKGKEATKAETDAIPEPTTRVPVVGDKSYSELDESDKKKNYAGTVDTLIKKARTPNRNNLT